MTEQKQLYCCSSYYQLLIALMKAFTQKQQIDLILEEHGMETAETLAERIERSDSIWVSAYVDRVFVCPDSRKVNPYTQRCASFLPWQRRRVLEHMEAVFAGKDARGDQKWRNRYGGIHVFWDLGYAGTYFNIRHIHYTLHEDSLNSYQHIRENRKNYAYLFRPKGLKFRFKKRFRIGVLPFGYSDCCDAVEVNQIEGIEVPPDKVTEVSRAELEKQLTQEQKKAVFDLFTGNAMPETSSENQTALILTEPFAVTGRLPDEAAQARLYGDVIREYGEDRKILIKPHPRDAMDYRKYFPEAEIMEKNLPMEILNFDETFRVFRAVTVTSSALQGIRCADEKVYLGPEFLHRYTGASKEQEEKKK